MNYLLKRLYQSEINVQINWMYDAGVNVKLGDKMNGFTHEKNFNGEDFEPIEQWLEETAKREFPKSVFARFYNKADSLLDMPINDLAEEIKEQVLSGASTSDIIQLLQDHVSPKYCMPDGINSKEDHEEYLKAIGHEKYVKDLQHHKDTTLGLYAFDQDLETIFENIPKSEKKGVRLEKMQEQIDYLKSIVFQIN